MSTLTVKNLQGVSPSNMITVPAGHKFYAPGCVVQVQSTALTTTSTMSSAGETPFQDISGLSVDIKPTSTSSKVYIICQLSINGENNNYNAFLRLNRSGTGIAVASSVESGYAGAATIGPRNLNSYATPVHIISFLDSPASTSTLTYKVQIANGGVTYINRSVTGAYSWYFTAISTITVMEVAQ